MSRTEKAEFLTGFFCFVKLGILENVDSNEGGLR